MGTVTYGLHSTVGAPARTGLQSQCGWCLQLQPGLQAGGPQRSTDPCLSSCKSEYIRGAMRCFCPFTIPQPCYLCLSAPESVPPMTAAPTLQLLFHSHHHSPNCMVSITVAEVLGVSTVLVQPAGAALDAWLRAPPVVVPLIVPTHPEAEGQPGCRHRGGSGNAPVSWPCSTATQHCPPSPSTHREC